MLAARVLFRASAFRVRTSDEDHERRFEFLGILTSPSGWKRAFKQNSVEKKRKNCGVATTLLNGARRYLRSHFHSPLDPAGSMPNEPSILVLKTAWNEECRVDDRAVWLLEHTAFRGH